MTKSDNLRKAKVMKNDEFYTQLSDIEKELAHYKAHFKGKTVYCNCNDGLTSNFLLYFILKFRDLGLSRVIATKYSFDGQGAYKIDVGSADIVKLIDFSPSGVVSFINDNNLKFSLLGNGDFRTPECLTLLDEADIVVTNPPFSLFREYLGILMDYGKGFLILGNKNSIADKVIFPLIRDNKLWLGYNSPKKFNTPSGVSTNLGGLTRWFTNLDIDKVHKPLQLIAKYDPVKYPMYDNYNAINVDKVADIPYDYEGMMGVPITFFDKYCKEQFEVVDIALRGAGDPSFKTKVYTKDDSHKYGDLNAGPVLNKKGVLVRVYTRLLIKPKNSCI